MSLLSQMITYHSEVMANHFASVILEQIFQLAIPLQLDLLNHFSILSLRQFLLAIFAFSNNVLSMSVQYFVNWLIFFELSRENSNPWEAPDL